MVIQMINQIISYRFSLEEIPNWNKSAVIVEFIIEITAKIIVEMSVQTSNQMIIQIIAQTMIVQITTK